ncbi:alpha-E domain-containing protein [Hyalangium rubrum]|uniref:Alpha-E domain-containing protein n=1 Tax=Hyalangium rubrum TaxID=3103134 RepID=A0ABU5HE58_9BACT|nr:alpha-E domain-containing protein [Hyalangium sp. s54d21]MDY7231754.1 alpha-E domain-containing protein [Hyalangium sp. s54d21]
MIARVAEHCFWLGRYLERAESTARVLQVTGTLALDAGLSPEQCWMPVLAVFGERARFAGLHGAAAEGDGERVQHFMAWEEHNPSSLLTALSEARENARAIREVVSIECWEAINEVYLWMHGEEGRAEFAQHRYGFYRHIRRAMQLCLGLFRSTMLHDTPLDFIWLGVLLERVGQTARVLDVHHHAFQQLPTGQHQVVETSLWLSLLRACSGFEAFMKRHQGRVTGDAVAAFLLFEPEFPRSIRYCLKSAHRYLAELHPPGTQGLPGARTEALGGQLLARLRPEVLTEPGVTIHGLLTDVVDATAAVCDSLSSEFFGSARALGSQSMSQ